MIKSIPLNKLIASPRIVRKRSDPAADAELKASVAAHGILPNLVVREGNSASSRPSLAGLIALAH